MTVLSLGQTVMTAGVADFIEKNNISDEEVVRLFVRHASGDWGDVPEEDRITNNRALQYGDRILSSYELGGETCWLITEWNRSVTTLLFPHEY